MTRKLFARYVDTPEIEALSTGYARERHFARGYGESRAFGNKLAMRATAVPEGDKAQVAYLAGRYGPHGGEGGQFLQSISGVKLQAELGLTSPYFLTKAFDANLRPSPNGFQQSNINGLDVLRAYKHPKPPPVGRPAPSAILSPPIERSTTYGTIISAPISTPHEVRTISPAATRRATRAATRRATRASVVPSAQSPVVPSAQSPVVAAALAAYQTRSAANRAIMDQRALASSRRLATSPTYVNAYISQLLQ